MKQIYLKFSMLLLCLVVGLSSWAEDVTGTINFGSGTGDLNVNSASVSGNDSQSNSWTVTTVGTTSFTPNADYAQIGASKSPATSITFTTTLPASQKITSFSAKFGGFSGTAGTVTLKVGDTTVGTGSLSGPTEVTVTNTNFATSGTVLTVTVTGISKGVKAYSINYTYEVTGDRQALPAPTNLASSNVTDRSATLSWDAVDNATGYKVKFGTAEYDVTTNSYSATGLTESTAYTWSVRAKGNGSTYDNSSYSSEQQFTTTAFVIAAGTYNIIPNNALWSTNYSGNISSVSQNSINWSGSQKGVSFNLKNGTSTSGYVTDEQTRVYNGYSLKVTAPTGYNLTNITFTADGTNWAGTHTASVGTMTDNKTWDGSANEVTISFKGTCRITNISVTYAADKVLKSIAVSGTPTKTTYEAGESIDPAGLIVTGTYNDESTATITDGISWTFNPTTLTAGTTSCTVTATVGTISSSAYNVTGLTVNAAKTLSSIAVTGTPEEFWKGDTFNHNGMTVTATWSNNTTTNVTNEASFSDPDMTTAGQKSVTVTYQDKETSYNIEIKTIANTAETAYTITKAKELYDLGKDLSSEVYVSGIVSKMYSSSVNSDGQLSFYISEDGTYSSSDFEFYKCLNLDGTLFANVDDVAVGAAVVGKGTLAKYNSTYELAEGCLLVSYTAPAVVKQNATISMIYNTTLNVGEDNKYTVTYNGDGELTTSSSKEDVATVNIDGNEVVVSAVGIGTTTITISANETDSYTSAERLYTLTVSAAPVKPEGNYVTFDFTDPASLGVTVPETSNGTDITSINVSPITMTVTNGSTNTRIWCDANDNYDLRIYKKATATFTAVEGYNITKIEIKGSSVTDITTSINKWDGLTTKEGSWTGNSQSVTITIGENTNNKWNTATVTFEATSVTPDPEEPSDDTTVKYVLVESQNDFVDGEYVIAINDNGTYKAMASNLADGYLDAVTVSVNDKAISTLNGATVWTVTTGTDASEYPIASFKNGTNYLSNNNGTLEYSTAEENFITYVSDGGEGTVYANDWQHWFGFADGFMMSSNDQNAPSLYFFKKIEKEYISITLNSACTDGEMIYGTFSSSKPLYVSDDVIVSEVGVKDGALNVKSYKTGDIIPANTGVMISAQEGGTYYLEVADAEMAELAESVLGEDNCLKPSGDNGITYDKFDNINYTYYRLTMHNGTQIGFWWGAAEGIGFDLGPNKAYLQVKKSASHDEGEDDLVKSFWFSNVETSISNINANTNSNDAIYNLNGQRVNTVTKGMYIKNGKKYFVK